MTKKGFGIFGIIQIILALAIIMYLYYLASNYYFGKPAMKEDAKKIMSEEGVSTASYPSLLDTTKKKLKESMDTEAKHMSEMENMK